MRKVFVVSLISYFLFLTSVAHAMTREEILTEITRLTAVAEVLAAQIRALGVQPRTSPGQTGTPTTTPVQGTPRFDPGSVCTRSLANLKQGMSSSDVVALQDELASIGVFAGSSTGYYGPATAAAVRQFQSVNGLPTTGTVGPATAQALYQACTGGATYTPASNGGTTTVAAVDRASLSVAPLTGSAPLSVTALFAINGTTCSSYELNWGDGSAPLLRTGSTTDCATDNINRQLGHLYAKPGSYTITLRTIRGNINAAPVVGQQVVTVQK